MQTLAIGSKTPIMNQFSFIVEEKGFRIDIWLADRIPDVSRNRIRDLIKKGFGTVNGETVKPSYSVALGDQIEFEIPPPIPSHHEPEDIPIDILHEDEAIIVVNKSPGLVVHPAMGNWTGTLVNALLHHYGEIAGVGGEERPGIVHRLDKDTSGVMVVAKTDVAHRRLQDQFRERETKKEYAAIVLGVPYPLSGTIDKPLARHKNHRVKRAVIAEDQGGRRAVSHYEVVDDQTTHALVRVRIETGRTHQIRVHMMSIGPPVIGDTVYGGKQPGFDAPRQLLHARRLGFTHPASGEDVAFEAPLPEDFGVWTADKAD